MHLLNYVEYMKKCAFYMNRIVQKLSLFGTISGTLVIILAALFNKFMPHITRTDIQDCLGHSRVA